MVGSWIGILLKDLTIDLNCDLGEYDDISQSASDAAIMPYISSCNIACGGHIGNDQTIAHCLELAQKHQVAVGAHPSYPDRANFGRTAMAISEAGLMDSLHTQINKVIQACQQADVPLHHIKPHGALYNQAAKDADLAFILVQLCKKLAPNAALMGLAHSAVAEAAACQGVRFIAEGFIDRCYEKRDALLPRSEAQAVHHNESIILSQALALATGHNIQNHQGQLLNIDCQSLCLHGDHPQAASHARRVAEHLQGHDILIAAC